MGVMALTSVMVVADVDRPLFPAQTLLKPLYQNFPQSDLLLTELDLYHSSYFRSFETRRKALQRLMPAGESVVGFYAGSNGVDEFAAWQPLGSRYLERVSAADPLEYVLGRGIRLVLVSDKALEETKETPADWMKKYRATLVASSPAAAMPNLDRIGCEFYLFRLGGSEAGKH